MKISTKGIYALEMVVDLAIYADDGNVYGRFRHCGEYLFSARVGVSDCEQFDEP